MYGNQLISTLLLFVFVPSVFGEKFLNDIGRNSLLGHSKKIAKFLLAALPSSMRMTVYLAC
jgi:hypothetical protein